MKWLKKLFERRKFPDGSRPLKDNWKEGLRDGFILNIPLSKNEPVVVWECSKANTIKDIKELLIESCSTQHNDSLVEIGCDTILFYSKLTGNTLKDSLGILKHSDLYRIVLTRSQLEYINNN